MLRGAFQQATDCLLCTIGLSRKDPAQCLLVVRIFVWLFFPVPFRGGRNAAYDRKLANFSKRTLLAVLAIKFNLCNMLFLNGGDYMDCSKKLILMARVIGEYVVSLRRDKGDSSEKASDGFRCVGAYLA